MNIVYLKNGERVILHQKLSENEYVIERLYIYNYQDGEPYEEPSGEKIFVDKVYINAPIESIDKQYNEKYQKYLDLNKSVQSLNEELQSLKNEVYKIKNEKTNLSKLIFNKSQLKTAKTIHYFISDRIMPVLMTDYAKTGMKMSLQVQVYSDSVRAWSYELHKNNDSWGSSDKIDDEYGFFFDLSDEELERITIERVKTFKSDNFYAGYLQSIDNKYLTKELIEIKEKFIIDRKEKQIADCRKTIQLKTTELNLLLEN